MRRILTHRHIHIRHASQIAVGPFISVIPRGGNEQVEEVAVMLEGKKYCQHLRGTVKGLASEDVALHRIAG